MGRRRAMDSSELSTAAATAFGAAQRISVRISKTVGEADDDSSCVVCLQACPSKACACSFMHQCCAVKYAATFGDACKVCEKKFEPARLSKRRIDDDEHAMERVARKRARVRAAAERAEIKEWARIVAPCAAQILLRHYLYSEEAERSVSGLCFASVVLSLVHSGPQYLDDLKERLRETQPPPVVEASVRRLCSLADDLTGEGVDSTCGDAFMLIFNGVLVTRLGPLAADQRGV